MSIYSEAGLCPALAFHREHMSDWSGNSGRHYAYNKAHNTNSGACLLSRGYPFEDMSQSGDGLHTPSYLSWRKLHLSRAKLKASSKTSALLSGFAMVAMVEVQLSKPSEVPEGMLIAFAICTTMLVAVHMLALMISTCILPNIETRFLSTSIPVLEEPKETYTYQQNYISSNLFVVATGNSPEMFDYGDSRFISEKLHEFPFHLKITVLGAFLQSSTCRYISSMSEWSSSSGRTVLASGYNRHHSGNNGCLHNRGTNNEEKMSQSGDGLHTPGYLSWRKLQLSRAKLKASSKTSALLSGFAMVAMVEVQLNDRSKVPQEMLIAFAICTTLLVAVHMLALMISTCILPNIDAVCNLHSISLVHESPHERLHWYIETAWAFSTLLGLLLFLCEIAILCWVKFYDFSKLAAWSACIVLIPVLIIFLAFAVHFYRSLVTHKYEVTVSGIRELELLKEQIEAGDTEGRSNGVGSYGNAQIV
ncbi:Calcium release-activated calcium channel protein 1 [Gryllus bimaculatus]|nr:Calcium release-activated calcium channel protein 1 [Gryllus bimaculatus]